MLAHRSRFDWNLVLGERYDLEGITEALVNMKAQRDIKPIVVPGAG